MNNTGITISSTQICICVYWRGENMFDSACAEANIFDEINTWYICRVFVKEHLRGKKIGSQILQTLLTEIKKQHAKKVIVTPGGYDVDEDRQFNFYIKNGFKHSTEDEKMLVFSFSETDDGAHT